MRPGGRGLFTRLYAGEDGPTWTLVATSEGDPRLEADEAVLTGPALAHGIGAGWEAPNLDQWVVVLRRPVIPR